MPIAPVNATSTSSEKNREAADSDIAAILPADRRLHVVVLKSAEDVLKS